MTNISFDQLTFDQDGCKILVKFQDAVVITLTLEKNGIDFKSNPALFSRISPDVLKRIMRRGEALFLSK